MITTDKMFELLAQAEERRNARRDFIKLAGGAVATTGAMTLLAACKSSDDDNQPSPTPTPAATTALAATDVDVLNFALNLEYLEASYYAAGALGSTVPTSAATGTGTQGAVTGGRAVTFTDANVRAYMREIASDESQHVNFLRAQLGTSAVAIPAINIDVGTVAAPGAFTAAARSAGIITTAQVFDPYASDENFLIGGILLSDVGVTAYKGAATLISSKTVLEAAAGILAVEAYHTGLIRSVLYRKGYATTAAGGTSTGLANVANFQKVSDLRDTLDGNTAAAGPPQLYADDDQGYGQVAATGGFRSNIVPADANGVMFGRTTSQVLNIVYQNASSKTAGASSGGFFPAGLNGNIKTSTATP